MSEYRATIVWNRQGTEFTYKEYTREHVWKFDGGSEVRATAAPQFLGDDALVDPEQAFVASLSSCHMLTFLAIAAKKRLVVDEYSDQPVGFLEKNADGKLAVTRVVLRPKIVFGGAGAPSSEEIARLHDKAHGHCFIANSVHTSVTVEEP